MMGWAVLKHCCWWKRKCMSAPATAQSKISDDELFAEWQRLHYLFIWPLYNIVNCDVLKWIQTRGSVMRTYWISVRGRLNPPGSPHTSHPAPPLPSWHSGGEVTSLTARLLALWRSSIKAAWRSGVHTWKTRSTNEQTTFTGCPNTYQAWPLEMSYQAPARRAGIKTQYSLISLKCKLNARTCGWAVPSLPVIIQTPSLVNYCH